MNADVKNLEERLCYEFRLKSKKIINELLNQYGLYYNHALKWGLSERVPEREIDELVQNVGFEIEKKIEIESVNFFKERECIKLQSKIRSDQNYENLRQFISGLESELSLMKSHSEKITDLTYSLAATSERLKKFLDHKESRTQESIRELNNKKIKLEMEIDELSKMRLGNLMANRDRSVNYDSKDFSELEKYFEDTKIIIGEPYLKRNKIIPVIGAVIAILVYFANGYFKGIERERRIEGERVARFKNEVKGSLLFYKGMTQIDKDRFGGIENYDDAFETFKEMVAGNRVFMMELLENLIGSCTLTLNKKLGVITNTPLMSKISSIENLVGGNIEVNANAVVDGKEISLGSCYSSSEKNILGRKLEIGGLCGDLSDVIFRLNVFIGDTRFEFQIGSFLNSTTLALNRDINHTNVCKKK